MTYGESFNDRNDHPSNNEAVLTESTEIKTAETIMKCGLTTVQKDTLVYEAIETMVQKNLSSLPVVDGMDLVGIISEKDVLRLIYDKVFLSGTVERYMTEKVVGFYEQDSLAAICDCLIEHHFRTVPIFRQNRLAGMISRADLIKASIDKFKPQGLEEGDTQKEKGLRARDIMKSGLVTVTAETPICEAMELLVDNNITGLPVVDEFMNLVGIVTEKDMLKLFVDPTASPGKTKDFMSEQVVSFDHNINLLDVCDCLLANHFRSVPVLKEGKLTGIISRSDVMVSLLKHKSIIFKQRWHST